MRTAKSYYKRSYHSNLSNSLKSLVSNGRLNELGDNLYSLGQKEIDRIEAKLA
jgi:hypothetical protein